MAVRDLEAFVRQRAALYDASIDLTSGSPFDVQVIQPIVRRLGTDPFTVDISTFMHERLAQAFPELANNEGDAVTDLLNKPTTLLWDPIVREIFRVKQGMSFQDPSTLTVEEADALGANLFSARNTGEFAKGPVRVAFTQAQSISVSPANFFTSKEGLHFFPTSIQSIRTEEMLLNVTSDGLFYFDVNVIAEAAGDAYNIDANSIVSIANIPSASRVGNLRRFTEGAPEENAIEYVDRLEQELSEKSLVTLRGISAKITKSFAEVHRLNVVGFNDPEMQRDVITGGGLGPIIAFGVLGTVIADSTSALSTRFQTTEVDFTAYIGPFGSKPTGYVLTLFKAFNGAPPVARDIAVSTVVSNDTIDLAERVLGPVGLTGISWMLRRNELTLSGIPGGILYPDGPHGTVTVPSGEVHIGGATDIYVRGQGFDTGILSIDNVTDDIPTLSGVALDLPTLGGVPPELIQYVELQDLKEGAGNDYLFGDATSKILEEAVQGDYSLQIVDGPSAGSYRVVRIEQPLLNYVKVYIDPVTPTLGSGGYRWRLVDVINVDLVEPKETRIAATDLLTVQGIDVLTTSAGDDFGALGVSKGDILRVLTGNNAGDYSLVADPLTPTTIQVDRAMITTEAGVSYLIFRPNTGGGISRPLVRITSIDLLDGSSQPIGATIPYAKPIDIQSRAFQNPGRGVKIETRDATLGIVSLPEPLTPLLGKQLTIVQVNKGGVIVSTNTVIFTAATTATAIVADINNQLIAQLTTPLAVVTTSSLGNRVGLRSVTDFTVCLTSDAAAAFTFFGDTAVEEHTSADIRSVHVNTFLGGWLEVTPAINQDDLDVAAIFDGVQVGFYGDLTLTTPAFSAYAGLLCASLNDAGDVLRTARFSPEADKRVAVGSRSIGSARCFFLEPTTIEFTRDSRFTLTQDDGSQLRFLPDPTQYTVRIPPAPNTGVQDGETNTPTTNGFASNSQDFLRSGIKPNDLLIIKYVPSPLPADIGTVPVLADPVLNLANTTFIFSLNGAPDRVLTFIQDNVTNPPGSVSQSSVVDQINASMGGNYVALTVANQLEFTGDASIVIKVGTSNGLLLGTTFSVIRNNDSPYAGEYTILEVFNTYVFVDKPLNLLGASNRNTYEIRRSGVQRISTTTMAGNQTDASLYYFDVELVSEGTGDAWNIDAAKQLLASNYRSDGYYLVTANENLTFSTAEDVQLRLSRSILQQGVTDSPRNATEISGQNIQINYERATLIADVQNFIGAETERVVNESPLARHLIPHYVRFDLNYVGGSTTDIVTADIETYIKGVFPQDAVEVSDIERIVSNRGASSIQNPVDLLAIVYDIDRTVQAQRSQDRLTTTRLATFIADLLTVTRKA